MLGFVLCCVVFVLWIFEISKLKGFGCLQLSGVRLCFIRFLSSFFGCLLDLGVLGNKLLGYGFYLTLG